MIRNGALRGFFVLLLLFLTTAFQGCSGTDSSAAEVRPTLEGLLPEDTFAYVHISNSEERSKEYLKSGLHKLYTHPEVKAFLQPFETYSAKMIDQDQTIKEATGLSFREFWDLLGGPLEVGVFNAKVQEQAMPGVVLALGAQDPAKLRDAATKVKASLSKRPGWETTEKKVGDHTVYSVGPEHSGFHYTVVGKTVLASLTRVHLETLIGAGAGGGLAKSPRYSGLRRRLSPEGRHLGLVYLGVASLWKALGEQIPPDARPVLEGLGVQDIPALGISLEYDLPQIRERYVVLTDRQDRGIPKLLAGSPGKDEAAGFVPTDAYAYGHLGLSVASLFDAVAEVSASQPDAQQAFAAFQKEFLSKLGVDLRKDLFGSLGPSWTMYSRAADAAPGQTETVAIVRLENEKVFFESLEKLAKAGDLPLVPLEGGVKGYAYTFEAAPAGPPGGAPPSPFAMPFAGLSAVLFAKEGWLFIGATPAKPSEFVARAGNAASGLDKNPRLSTVLKKVPDRVDAVMLQDLGASVGPLLQLLRSLPPEMSAQLKNPETGESMLDPKKLPKEATLKDLLGISVTYKVTQKDAIIVDSRSEVGATSMSAVMGTGVAAALLLPAISKAIQSAKTASCANNLSQLWSMQNNYRVAFGGRLKRMPTETGSAFWLALSKTQPPLIDETFLDIFVCPVAGMPPRAGFTTYLGPKSDVNPLPPNAIVGACTGFHANGSILVLRKSGDVAEVSPGDPLHEKVLQETRR